MKDNIMKFISKANQIIFFLVAVGLALVLLFNLVSSWLVNPWQPQQVKVIESDTKDGQVQAVVEYLKVHAGKIKDTHIFELYSNYIQSGFKHEMKLQEDADEMMDYYSGDSKRLMSVVNIMFVDSNDVKNMLFEKDVMILNRRYANFNKEYVSKRVAFNLYNVVSKDSNGDGVLDDNDKQDLYRTLYNGQQRVRIMDDIYSYEIIGDDLLLISHEENNEMQFYEYNLKSGMLRKLNTEIKSAN